MANTNDSFDVVIVGGSYAGLSAALALARSLRKVLVIDSGQPCNRQTPHSHNFIMHDGETPLAIAEKAKAQVLSYKTVSFHNGICTNAQQTDSGFTVYTKQAETFSAKKILFATGVKDVMPGIKGFAECWGISVLHCPYCHGYEVRHQHLGLIGNGDIGFEFCRMISNWSKKLTLFTNGPSTLSNEQAQKIKQHKITIVEKEIFAFEHTNGKIQKIVLNDHSSINIDAVFAKPPSQQHCDTPEKLGCELNEHGYIKIDDFQRTTVKGVYAAGDNTTMYRAVSVAVAAGTKAGAFINKELIEEEF